MHAREMQVWGLVSKPVYRPFIPALPGGAAFSHGSDLISALAENPEQHQKKVDEIEVEGEGS